MTRGRRPPRLPSPRARLALACVAAGFAVEARAVDCTPPTGTSTCVDADNVWTRPAPSRLASVGARIAPPGRVDTMVRLGYQRRPIVVSAPSPDPEGRDLEVVADTTTLTLGGALSPIDRLSVGLVLSMVPFRRGTGTSGIASRSIEELPSPVLRDPRVSVAGAALRGPPHAGLDVTSGIDASIPLGARGSFSGARGFVVAPWVALEWRAGHFVAGTEIGARLVPSVRIAGTELGHRGALSLGAGYREPADEYGITLELRSLVPLTGAPRRSPSGELVKEFPLVAEGLVAAYWSPTRDRSMRVTALVGRALPLAWRSVDGDGSWVTAPTAPALRAVLGFDLSFGAAGEPGLVRTRARPRRSDPRPEGEYPESVHR